MNPMFPKPRFWAEGAAQKANRPSLFGELLSFFLVFFAASLIQGVLLGLPASVWMLNHSPATLSQLSGQGGAVSLEALISGSLEQLPDWIVPAMLITQAVLIAAVIFYCRRFEHRTIPTLGLTKGKALPEYALGVLVGLGLFGLVGALGGAFGAYRFGGLQMNAGAELWLLAFALGYAIQGAAEELLVRGYLAVSVSKRYPVPLAAIFSSLVYMLLHSGSSESGVLILVNTFLFGLTLCLYTLKRGSIWGACAIHGAWNFAQCCLLGFGVDAINGGEGLIKVSVNEYNNALTGGSAGPEASLLCTVVLLAALGAALALKAKDPAPEPQAPAQTEE